MWTHSWSQRQLCLKKKNTIVSLGRVHWCGARAFTCARTVWPCVRECRLTHPLSSSQAAHSLSAHTNPVTEGAPATPSALYTAARSGSCSPPPPTERKKSRLLRKQSSQGGISQVHFVSTLSLASSEDSLSQSKGDRVGRLLFSARRWVAPSCSKESRVFSCLMFPPY